MRVLIPGMSGHVARRVALELHEAGHQVVGIDARPWADRPRGIPLYQLDLRKRAAEDVFRTVRPEVVIHLGTMSALSASGDERYRINLGGTQAVFAHSHTYGAKQVIFVGRHTFYGAGPDTPLYHTEDEPPQALAHFPELSDLVAADLYAQTALWRFPELCTTILRVCYTLGPSGHGTLANFVRGKRVPTVMGFDPLFQFLHEDDAADAIVRAVEKRPRGVFNVAGPQPLPLSYLIRETHRTAIPIPEPLLTFLLGRRGLPSLPRGALEHIKFPIVIDASRFQAATGFKPKYDELETVRAFLHAFPVK
ncbi:MAG: SDR family oxidoreductase [Deltaproteobacteria bacterium]|nr:SDR family oxidoreductase [Deltaproteobacteria bacterium]